MSRSGASSYQFVVLAALICLTSGAAFGIADAIHDDATRLSLATSMTGGDPKNAEAAFRRYGCAGCHTIAGIAGADGEVGPSLAGLSKRVYIAGHLENRPQTLIAWIAAPERLSPGTAMPDTGISEREARDLAAYLYAH
jgi:cytochrome c